MKPSELLKQKNWCQGSSALDKHGFSVNIDDPDAVSFCLTGALKFCYKDNVDEYTEAFNEISARVNSQIILWNDDYIRTKEDVIKLLESVGR